MYYNDEYEWNSVYTDDYINAYAFYENGIALIEGDKTGSDFVVNHITNKAIGFVTDILPILNVDSESGVGTINPKAPKFYYVAGGNLSVRIAHMQPAITVCQTAFCAAIRNALAAIRGSDQGAYKMIDLQSL